MKRTTGWLVLFLLPFTVPTAEGALFLQPGFDQVQIGDVDGRTRAWGVAVADFDADGLDDVVSGDTFGDVHLFLGQGDGSFTDLGVVINMPFHDAYALGAGDFNNDGMQDFVLSCTASYSTTIADGGVYLFLGNGDGTFQSTGFPQVGLFVGDAGTDVVSLAVSDVDGDDDLDIVAGDIVASENGRADVTLFRNQLMDTASLSWVSETVLSVEQLVSIDPEQPPYFPPTLYLHAYGLAFGDVDGDGDQDLLVGDRASYLYVYANDGTGQFEPVRYEKVPTRPYAYGRLHETFASHMALATADLNGDGRIDLVSGGTDAQWEGRVDLWLNTGLDSSGHATFSGSGIIGGAGIDARGLATGQLNSSVDHYPDVVFGNYEGNLYALFADITDTDGDGIVDRFDNAPSDSNAPRIDMNTDGGINHFDQLDNDFDGLGDPADPDDDDDGVLDETDNCPFLGNPLQEDADGDGRGDACDPLHDADLDGDGVPEWPTDPALRERAAQAKMRWSKDDTHFIVRIDALGRVFQNEFTQTLADAAILSPEEWEVKKFENYNGIGDAPALPGYNVPEDLQGGMNVPITLITIPKQIWEAFGDDDPVRWINARITDPDLEIGQHGTYHFSNTPLGDWASELDRYFYSCETCGLTLEENLQLLRVGRQTLLGDYGESAWIQQSGADPASSPSIDWSMAANPLISYAPPFNASDQISRDAVARLGHLAFSASIFEEGSSAFSPEGSHHEQFDAFGLFHASADLEVDPPETAAAEAFFLDVPELKTLQKGEIYNWPHEESELPQGLTGEQRSENATSLEEAPGVLELQSGIGGVIKIAPEVGALSSDYETYLESITQFGGLNTWLIEEVEWSSRYCNDQPRLDYCPGAPGGINRENNMVDPARWANWLTLLAYVRQNGMTWTQGDYSLAMSYDNAPTVFNPDQTDSDHDGIGDAVSGAALATDAKTILGCYEESVISARLSNGGAPLPGQTVIFHYDADGDGQEEMFSGATDAEGIARATVFSTRALGLTGYRATWDGGVTSSEEEGRAMVVYYGTGRPPCPFPGKGKGRSE